MPSGPENSIDQQLKAYARRRRQEHGVPGPLPDQVRKRLASEVESVFGRRKGSVVFSGAKNAQENRDGVVTGLARWLAVWWPRVVWGVGTVGVVVFLAVLIWRSEVQKPTSEKLLTGNSTLVPAETNVADKSPAALLKEIPGLDEKVRSMLEQAARERAVAQSEARSAPEVSVAAAPAPAGSVTTQSSSAVPSSPLESSLPSTVAPQSVATTSATAKAQANTSVEQSRPARQLAISIKTALTNSPTPAAAPEKPSVLSKSDKDLAAQPVPVPQTEEIKQTARLMSRLEPRVPVREKQGSDQLNQTEGNMEKAKGRAATSVPPTEVSAKPGSSALETGLVSNVIPSASLPPLSSAKPVEPSRPAATSAVGPSAKAAIAATGARHFVRSEFAYRRNLNSPPLPNVLKTFSFEVTGNQVRVEDSDGSVYEGRLVESALPSTGRPGAAFRVEGMSSKLKQQIVFEGDMIGDSESERIQGRVRVAGQSQFPMSATRAPR